MATGSLWVLAVNGAERALPSNATGSQSIVFSFIIVCPFHYVPNGLLSDSG